MNFLNFFKKKTIYFWGSLFIIILIIVIIVFAQKFFTKNKAFINNPIEPVTEQKAIQPKTPDNQSDIIKWFEDKNMTMDKDGDYLLGYDEVKIYNTDPNNPDTDGDGFKDGEEIQKYRTDPKDSNSKPQQ